jgi:hypothetical protein
MANVVLKVEGMSWRERSGQLGGQESNGGV